MHGSVSSDPLLYRANSSDLHVESRYDVQSNQLEFMGNKEKLLLCQMIPPIR